MAKFDRAAGECLNRRSAAAMDNLHVKTVFFVKPLIAGQPDRTIGCGQRTVNNFDRDFLAGGRLCLRLVVTTCNRRKKLTAIWISKGIKALGSVNFRLRRYLH